MGNNYVNNYGGYNIINQTNSFESSDTRQITLDQFGIEVKKEIPFSLKLISELLGLVVSLLSLVQLTHLDKGLSEFGSYLFSNLQEAGQNSWIIIASGILVGIFLVFCLILKSDINFIITKHSGCRFRDTEKHKTYVLKKRTCPLCGRKSRLLVKRLNAAEFVFSCTNCKNKVHASLSEIFIYSERTLRHQKETNEKKD